MSQHQPIVLILIAAADLPLFTEWSDCRGTQVEHGSDGARILTLMEMARRYREEQAHSRAPPRGKTHAVRGNHVQPRSRPRLPHQPHSHQAYPLGPLRIGPQSHGAGMIPPNMLSEALARTNSSGDPCRRGRPYPSMSQLYQAVTSGCGRAVPRQMLTDASQMLP